MKIKVISDEVKALGVTGIKKMIFIIVGVMVYVIGYITGFVNAKLRGHAN